MTPSPPGPRWVEIGIRGPDWELKGQVAVPDGPATLNDLLPVARNLSDAIVGETVKRVERSGERISCCKGCGACCRQLVAISEVEARRLRAVVENFPEPRKSQTRARFAEARERLERAGLSEALRRTADLTEAEYSALSAAYFKQQIACPFLEEESCSIYDERPITCREYLVTSPAENCAQPVTGFVRQVQMPLKVFNAVARWQVPPGAHVMERWVPLTFALEWALSHQDDPPPIPGKELLRELLDHLGNQEAPAPGATASPQPETREDHPNNSQPAPLPSFAMSRARRARTGQ